MVGIADTHPRQDFAVVASNGTDLTDDAQTYRSPVSRPGGANKEAGAAVAGYRAKPAGLPG